MTFRQRRVTFMQRRVTFMQGRVSRKREGERGEREMLASTALTFALL